MAGQITNAKLQMQNYKYWECGPPCTASADTKHHTGAKYSLGDVDLPVISAAIQNPEISFQFERDQILDQGLFWNCRFKGFIINVHLVPRTPAVPLDQFGWKWAILCFGPYNRTCEVSCMIRLSKALTHLMWLVVLVPAPVILAAGAECGVSLRFVEVIFPVWASP